MTKNSLFTLSVVIITMVGCGGDTVQSKEDQFLTDIEIIDAYIADQGIDSVFVDPSGVKYVVNVQGTGIKPILSDVIRVKFEGRLLETGVVFDSSDAADLVLNETIGAWQIVLPKMNEGSSYTIFTPSLFAYGFNGRPPFIPSNAILIFDIELLRVGN